MGEAAFPGGGDAGFQSGGKVGVGALLVAGEGGDVISQRGFGDCEVGQVEDGVEFAEFGEGVAVEVFEGDFVETAAGDQGEVGEEGVVHFVVLTDDPVLDDGGIGFLKRLEGAKSGQGTAVGLENCVGIPVDVDKFRAGEYFEEEADAGGVGRGFQDERPAWITKLQFFQKIHEAATPLVEMGGGDIAKGKEFEELFGCVREDGAEVGGFEGGEAEGHFVFLGRGGAPFHLVDGPIFWQEAREHAGVALEGGEEGVGEEGFAVVGVGETRVLGEKLMQVGGAGTPMAKDENGRFEFGALNFGVKTALFLAEEGAVFQAEGGDGQGPNKVAWMNGKVLVAEETEPVAEDKAAEQAGAKCVHE